MSRPEFGISIKGGKLSHQWGRWARRPGLLSWAGGWHRGGRAATGCTPEDRRVLAQSVCTFGQEDSSSPTQSAASGSVERQGWCLSFPLHCPCFSSNQSLMDPGEPNKSVFLCSCWILFWHFASVLALLPCRGWDSLGLLHREAQGGETLPNQLVYLFP